MNLLPLARHACTRQIARNTRLNYCKCNSGALRRVQPAQRSRHLHTVVHPPRTAVDEAVVVPNISLRFSHAPRRGAGVAAAVGLGLGAGMTMFMARTALLEPSPPGTSTPTNASTNVPANAYDPNTPLPEPKGIANPYELSFGAICGICAGVFVKKGLKAAAFLLGGVFVLLQYFNRLSWIKVDWNSAGNRFQQTLYGSDGRAPTIQTAFQWLLNFVMADFQPRASFIAGFVLGLRVG